MSIRPDEALAAPWWPELLAVKDTLSYEALSHRFDVSIHVLRRALDLAGETKVNMPRGPKRRTPALDTVVESGDPLERIRAKVGRMPDADVAELAGVSVDDVKAYRRDHGIAPFLRPPPAFAGTPKVESAPTARVQSGDAEPVVLRRRVSEEGASEETVRRPSALAEAPPQPTLAAFHDRMGQVADQVIADEAGVARTAVGAYRRKHGIPAYDGFRYRSSEAPTEERATDGRSQRSTIIPYMDLLGTTPDSEIAAMAGVTRAAVAKFRARRGIAGFEGEGGAVEPPRVASGRSSKLDAYAELIGVLTDAEVARRAGMSGEAVRAFRKRHGIEAGSRRGVVVEAEAQVEAPASSHVEVAEAAPPAAAHDVTHHAFVVLAARGEEVRRFAVVGVDVSDALARAVAGLAARVDGPWRVKAIRESMEALTTR